MTPTAATPFVASITDWERCLLEPENPSVQYSTVLLNLHYVALPIFIYKFGKGKGKKRLIYKSKVKEKIATIIYRIYTTYIYLLLTGKYYNDI